MFRIPSSPSFLSQDAATAKIYTLSLHDALPIWDTVAATVAPRAIAVITARFPHGITNVAKRSEEHTSELQSHHDVVCRLLREKKKRRGTERKSTTTNRSATCTIHARSCSTQFQP